MPRYLPRARRRPRRRQAARAAPRRRRALRRLLRRVRRAPPGDPPAAARLVPRSRRRARSCCAGRCSALRVPPRRCSPPPGALIPGAGRRQVWFGFVSRYAFWRGVRSGMSRERWRQTTRGVPVLMYHAFTDSGEGDRYVMPGGRFARQMRLLALLRYRVDPGFEQLAPALRDFRPRRRGARWRSRSTTATATTSRSPCRSCAGAASRRRSSWSASGSAAKQRLERRGRRRGPAAALGRADRATARRRRPLRRPHPHTTARCPTPTTRPAERRDPRLARGPRAGLGDRADLRLPLRPARRPRRGRRARGRLHRRLHGRACASRGPTTTRSCIPRLEVRASDSLLAFRDQALGRRRLLRHLSPPRVLSAVPGRLAPECAAPGPARLQDRVQPSAA